jgi:signal transduction histidine kinase
MRQLPKMPASRPPAMASRTAMPMMPIVTVADHGTGTVWVIVGDVLTAAPPPGVAAQKCWPVGLVRAAVSFGAMALMIAMPALHTPLARQRTLAEVALDDPDRTVASLEAAFRRVLAAGQQQEKLIEALLTLARSQRGLDRSEPVDLAAIAAETALARSAEAAQHEIAVTVQNCPVVFPGDVRLIERLVANMVDNAIRHNYSGGDVLVQTALDRGQAVLVVTNSGPLVGQDEVAGLFEPFRHGPERRTGVGDSPGLGLSTVDAIAAAHGAPMWATPRPDGGLEIQVRFPRAQAGQVTSVPSTPGRPQTVACARA